MCSWVAYLKGQDERPVAKEEILKDPEGLFKTGCSNCKGVFYLKKSVMVFCHYCGAKLDWTQGG